MKRTHKNAIALVLALVLAACLLCLSITTGKGAEEISPVENQSDVAISAEEGLAGHYGEDSESVPAQASDDSESDPHEEGQTSSGTGHDVTFADEQEADGDDAAETGEAASDVMQESGLTQPGSLDAVAEEDGGSDAAPGLAATLSATPLGATASPTGMAAQYSNTYDADELFPQSDANDWQIVSGGYAAMTAGEGIYSYSIDYAVRLQKAAIPTGIENEFQVYLNVEPQVSWEEFFKSLDNYQTHNNSSTFNPSSGCSRLYSEEEYNDMTPEEQALFSPFTVAYTMSDGRVFEVIRYGNFTGDGKDAIQNVPNGSYAWSSEKFNTNGLIRGINWRPLVNGSGRLEVDARGIEQRFSFATDIVYPRTVTDPMGDGIIYQGKISFDEGSVVEPDVGTMEGTLEWSLPTAEYPDPPYFSFHTEDGVIPGTNVPGLVTVVDNVEVVLINGKYTAYYTGILEGRYAITLDVESSCAPLNNSPADSIKPTNGDTLLAYEVGTSTRTTEFDVPEVRGLLYDIEVIKIDDSPAGNPVPGAVFALYDEDGEQIATAMSAGDGSLKFRNLPTGTYTLQEVSAPEGYQMTGDGIYGPFVLCWTTNQASLAQDHGSGHDADQAFDARNMAYASMPLYVTNRYVMSLTILKRDGVDQSPLQGARFSLRADDGDGLFTETDSVAMVFVDPELTETAGEEVETDEDGYVSLFGIGPGTYWIVETWAPDGYELMSSPVRMVVTGDHRVLFYETGEEVLPDSSHCVSVTIDNLRVPPLPASGATGRNLPIAIGVSLMALSALLLVAVSRRLCSTD